MKNGLFSWKRFSENIILLFVRWYLNYSLRFRGLKETTLDKAIELPHTTILRYLFAGNCKERTAIICTLEDEYDRCVCLIEAV